MHIMHYVHHENQSVRGNLGFCCEIGEI